MVFFKGIWCSLYSSPKSYRFASLHYQIKTIMLGKVQWTIRDASIHINSFTKNKQNKFMRVLFVIKSYRYICMKMSRLVHRRERLSALSDTRDSLSRVSESAVVTFWDGSLASKLCYKIITSIQGQCCHKWEGDDEPGYSSIDNETFSSGSGECIMILQWLQN